MIFGTIMIMETWWNILWEALTLSWMQNVDMEPLKPLKRSLEPMVILLCGWDGGEFVVEALEKLLSPQAHWRKHLLVSPYDPLAYGNLDFAHMMRKP